MAEKDLNRIKVMLAEKGKTNKWLAEKIGAHPTFRVIECKSL